MLIKKGLKLVARIFLILFISLLLLELCYRMYLIDFYKPEFEALNPNFKKSTSKKSTLVIGDSFSASPHNYVGLLNEKSKHYSYYNASIPGTGILQHKLYAATKLEEVSPARILYQLYIGNDFLDIQKPINFTTLSLSRNLYSWLSQRLLVIQFINYRLGSFKTTDTKSFEQLQSFEFDPDLYNSRQKLYFKGNPSYLEEMLYLNSELHEDTYQKWVLSFRELLASQLNEHQKIYLLIIPHCAQVDALYLDRMNEIGASNSSDLLNEFPPLYQRIQKDFPAVSLLNPISFFHKSKQVDNLYFGNDPHLSEYGQQQVFEYLTSQGID